MRAGHPHASDTIKTSLHGLQLVHSLPTLHSKLRPLIGSSAARDAAWRARTGKPMACLAPRQGLAMRSSPAGLACCGLPPVRRDAVWRPAGRRSVAVPLASRQVAVAVPQQQPPALAAPDPRMAGTPKWALAAGMLAVAAAALKLAWSFRQPASPPPPPPDATLDAAAAEESPAMQAARAAVQQAGQALAASGVDGAAAAAAAAAGPVLLAAETAGALDETAAMSLEQLRATATELYMLIQQVVWVCMGGCMCGWVGAWRVPRGPVEVRQRRPKAVACAGVLGQRQQPHGARDAAPRWTLPPCVFCCAPYPAVPAVRRRCRWS